jgi:hypothetical protein
MEASWCRSDGGPKFAGIRSYLSAQGFLQMPLNETKRAHFDSCTLHG